MNSLATRESVSWHRTFLMLKPNANPATDLEPLRQHLSAVSRSFQVECSNCFRGMTQMDIDRFLNQTLVFYSAGAGISELQKDYRRLLGILGLLVALVLLIACVNVANMMSAQAAARGHEMALRISIGAGRRRLVQLILAQSTLLALVASVLGAFFAAWSAPFVLSLINPHDNPARLALPADWRVLLFGFGLIIFVVLLLGLLPALRASAVRPVAALKGGEDPHSPRRLMRGAIAVQVAFCFLVLFLSSLFVTSFQHLEKRPLGFSTDRLLLLETVPAKASFPWSGIKLLTRSVPSPESTRLPSGLAPSRAHPHKQFYLCRRRASQSDSCMVPERFPGLALDHEDSPRFRRRPSPGRHLARRSHRQRNLCQDLLPRPRPHRSHL